MENFSIHLTNEDFNDPKKMETVQKIMDDCAEATNKEIEKVAREYEISDFAAMDVVYLRTRSRWTQELENRLIQEHREGKQINICDWPPD